MQQYLIMSINDYKYAISLEYVVEVLKEGVALPLLGRNNKEIVGLAKVREEVMPLINGNYIYANEDKRGSFWVVLEKSGKKMALTVSAATDLIEAVIEVVQGSNDQIIKTSSGDVVSVVEASNLFSKYMPESQEASARSN